MREAGPRTRWFIATGTAAASRCIKVNTQPPAGPNPAFSQPSPLPPTLAATASSLPPRPRPRPGPVPRPWIDSEGLCRGVGGVGCACGRKCVWPGLSCDSALTQVSFWPPPAPGAVGPETFRGGWRLGGCGAAASAGERGGGLACVPQGASGWLWAWGCTRSSLPLAAHSALPQCVWRLLWHAAWLGSATRCVRESGGARGPAMPLEIRAGGRSLVHPRLPGGDPAAEDCELPAKTAEGHRGSRAACRSSFG